MKDLVTVRIESPAFEADAVQVVEITGTETISRLFEMTLRLVALDPAALDEEKLLTSAVDLVFERTNDATHVVTEERRIGGMISALRDRFHTDAEHREVVATFVPKAWLTTLTRTTDIFQDMTVPDIVKKKLETGAGLVGADVEMRLKRTYPAREFVVQYKESDHDFVCRLTEDLGIHFFFERKGDKDVIVFADENEAFKPTVPDHAPFMRREEAVGVYQIEATRSVVPKVFKTRDYNYRNPAMDLMGEVDQPTVGANGLVDEFGPHAKTTDEAKFYATVRAQEANTRHFVFQGNSDLPGLRAGSKLVVEGHPRGELNLVVIEVQHDAKQAAHFGAAGDVGYRNSFKAIPEKVTFRPSRVTPKPVVHGVVTGIVQSESSTSFGAIDAEGRYRVSFMYDTVSDRGEGKASRPLRMAQPSAGADRGFHQPLKAGTEVIITCLNGDPDRPIISGAVPNPQTPSPVTSANAEKSMWKTNVSQMAFDDDKPRMKMTVDGTHIFQMGQPNGPEEGFYMETAANYTNTATGVATQVASTLQTIQDFRTAIAMRNIIDAAGLPKKWNILDHVEKWGGQVVGWAKTAAAMPTALKKAGITEAGGIKKEAEKKQIAAKAASDAKLKEELSKAPPAPIQRTNPDGTTFMETPEQALDRAVAQRMTDDAAFQSAIDANNEKIDATTTSPAERQQAKDDNKALKEKRAAELGLNTTPQTPFGKQETPEQAIDRALGTYLSDTAETRAANKELAAAAAHEKKVADEWANHPYNLETGTVANLIKDGEAAVNALSAGRKLASVISKIMSEVLDQTQIAAMVAQLVREAGAMRNSGQRHSRTPGKFTPPVNIQYSSNSAALHGMMNASVVGRSHVDVYGRYVKIAGLAEVHLKAQKLVEASAKDVFVSAKEGIDLYAKKTVSIVAEAATHKMPPGSSVFVLGKEDVQLESKTKSLHITAAENFTTLAKKGNTLIVVDEGDILMKAKKGKFDLEVKTNGMTFKAPDAEATFESKTDMKLTTTEGSLQLAASAGEVTVKASKDLKLACKAGEWHADGDINVKAANVKMNGSKIFLL